MLSCVLRGMEFVLLCVSKMLSRCSWDLARGRTSSEWLLPGLLSPPEPLSCMLLVCAGCQQDVEGQLASRAFGGVTRWTSPGSLGHSPWVSVWGGGATVAPMR